VSNPVGEAQVVPTTRFKLNRDGVSEAAPRLRSGVRPLSLAGRNGELDGVSRRRLEGVEAIVLPLAAWGSC